MDDSTRALTVVRESLLNALNQLHAGKRQEYDKILQVLSTSMASPQTLPIWFTAMSHCTSSINSRSSELVTVIFSYDYCGDDEARLAFEVLLCNIVSSNSSMLDRALNYLVRLLLPVKKPDETVLNYARTIEIAPAVHRTLARVLSVAPLAPTTLFAMLRDAYPHKVHPLESHRVFLSALLQISQYCPLLQDRIIALIVDRMILIDVEIRLDDPDENDLIFNVELDASGGGLDGRDASAVAAFNEQQADMVSKLDMMMGQAFAYLDEQCRTPTQTQAMFRILLKVFDRAVLHTHRSKYTQFLLFYVCHVDISFATQFVGYLIKTGIESTQHTITRQAALAYAGSFLARAKYVAPHVVRSIVKAMLDWALMYIERTAMPANLLVPAVPQQHVVFYSVCQAVFYTTCFRFPDIVDATNPNSLAQLGLVTIISCPLNPFKFCSKVVVREFKRVVMRGEQRLPVEEIVQRNKRIFAPPLAGSEQLDSFFPFDPFLLKDSSAFITPLYHQWQSMRDESGTSDDEESDSEGDEVEGEGEGDSTTYSTDEESEAGSYVASSADAEEGMHLEDLMSLTPDVTYDLDFHFSNAR